MTFRPKKPTDTSTVFEALQRADDFLTTSQLRDMTGINGKSVSRALGELRLYNAVSALNVEGTLWWYATPESDQRLRVHHERTPEVKPRRVKGRHVAKV